MIKLQLFRFGVGQEDRTGFGIDNIESNLKGFSNYIFNFLLLEQHLTDATRSFELSHFAIGLPRISPDLSFLTIHF
jgi:hypothetical protein